MFIVAYGQHQSFHLRGQWLSKAIDQLDSDNRFFYDPFAFEKIGIGKNMVKSLKHWAVATGVVIDKNERNYRLFYLSPFGELVKKYDKGIHIKDTASLLHFHLVKEREPASIWYWFFQVENDAFFSKEELYSRSIAWVNRNESKSVSENSIKKDIDCLLRLYTTGENVDDPEDVIQSPLYKIGLLNEDYGVIQKRPRSYHDIGLGALYFVLLKYAIENNRYSIAIEEFSSENGLWGKIFNMSRVAIVEALEVLTKHKIAPIIFTRTNNLDTIRVPTVDPIYILEETYKSNRVGVLS
jgi:hypothetical protein